MRLFTLSWLPLRLLCLVLLLLLLLLVCAAHAHERRKYPEKVHRMVRERLARQRWRLLAPHSSVPAAQWSSWGSWSACSLSCGGGVSTQSRHCRPATQGRPRRRHRTHKQQRQPHPNAIANEREDRKHHRRHWDDRTELPNTYCVGVYRRFHMCNQQACEGPPQRLREQQCAAFNSQPYLGKTYRWLPHYSRSRPCALNCRPEGLAFYVTLASAVRDGTPCHRDGAGDGGDGAGDGYVCAAGICQMVGCDGVLGSGRLRDACGQCGGRNATCQLVSAIFTEPYLQTGYQLVAQLPAGACSIHVQQLAPTKNYLALRDSKGEYIINGDWNIDLPGGYGGAGARFLYRRADGAAESISAQGPITQPVDVVLLYRQANRGVKYEYAIKNSSLTSMLPRLPSAAGPGGAASGVKMALASPPPQSVVMKTQRKTMLAVPEHQADQPPQRDAPATSGTGFVSPLYHPPGGGRPVASVAPAAARGVRGGYKRRRRRRKRRRHRFQWVVTGYGPCSRTCGEGIQTTEVVCMKRKHKQLAPDRQCDPTLRPPPSTQRCVNKAPCPSGQADSNRAREQATVGRGQEQLDTEQSELGRGQGEVEQPDRVAARNGSAVDNTVWKTAMWSPCSVTCGWGQRRRLVSCVATDRARCASQARPRERVHCRLEPCPGEDERAPPADQGAGTEAEWMVTEWSKECSAACGDGVYRRRVTCVSGSGSGSGSQCRQSERPPETRPCRSQRLCSAIWFSGPWSECSHECNWGVQHRSVVCLRYSGAAYTALPASDCSAAARPARQRRCGAPRATCPPRWHVGVWGTCSGTCGRQRQRRPVRCLSGLNTEQAGCEEEARPAISRRCHQQQQCPATGGPAADADANATLQLYGHFSGATDGPGGGTGNYTLGVSQSEVSTSAGEMQNSLASVFTDDTADKRTSAMPSTEPPPRDTEPAGAQQQQHRTKQQERRRHRHKHRHHQQRPAADQPAGAAAADDGSCEDRFNNCLLVQQARLCKYKYYRSACCRTCRRGKRH